MHRHLLLPILILLLAPFSGLAQTSPSGVDAWAQDPRVLEVKPHERGFEFSSRRNSSLGADLLEGGYDASRHAFTLKFHEDARPGDVATLEVLLREITEFVDEDGNSRLDPGDPIAQRLRFDSLASPSLELSPRPDESTWATVTYPFPAPTQDGQSLPTSVSREFVLRFVFLERPIDIGAERVPPTEIPTDVSIKAFPFRWSNTTLVLDADLAASRGAEVAGSGIVAASGAYRAFYDWSIEGTEGLRKGATVVESDAPASGQEQATVLFAYPQSERIVDHHKAGVTLAGEPNRPFFPLTPEGNALFFLLGLLVVASALAWTVRRRMSG